MRFVCARPALLVFVLLSGFAPAAFAADEIVLYAGDVQVVRGGWRKEASSSAAAGVRLRHPNAGAAKLTTALASPSNDFEVTFTAEAGVPYRLWMRGRADEDSWANDSVFVQFNDSVDGSGLATWRIGGTSATVVNLEDCSNCGLSAWGWQDNGWGVGVLGPLVRFASTGTHTMRVQTREDGLAIDQIVLSPARYLSAAPGALKNDTTIVPKDPGTASPTLVRGPFLQQVTSDSAVVVWATLEAGASEVRYSAGSAALAAHADSTLFPATRTGVSFDYYQHVAELSSLGAATTYTYDIFTGGADAAPGRTFQLTTAPASSSTASTRFIVFGDSGVGSDAQRQLATLMASDAFHVALHAGDLAYGNSGGTGGGTYRTLNDWFFDIYAGWLHRRPVWPATGNHDSRASNNDGQHYIDMFALPGNERYYSFDWGQVHFVVLDTEYWFQDTTRRPTQLAWLENDLAATDRPWKVAVYHRSPFSSGGEHGSDLAVRSAFAPIFERYGVQLSISAHEHIYERTKPQQTTSTGSPVVYVVSGGGGGPLYPAGASSFTAYSASRYHYVRGAASDCTLALDAVGTDGVVFDTATLDRCAAPPPPPPPSPGDVVIYAADILSGGTVRGNWSSLADSTAAAGVAIRSKDWGDAKVTTPSAAPADYFEYTFSAAAGTAYRLWIRGRATNNYWASDSVYAQFDGQIGTTAAHTVNLEDCGGCGLAGWGWQDNGWGAGVLGPTIQFSTAGTHRIRVQTREDGFIIDQIVLSPSTYVNSSPGKLKNDTTILAK